MKSKKVKKILLIALTCVAISASVSAEAAMKSQITIESKNKYEQLKISESLLFSSCLNFQPGIALKASRAGNLHVIGTLNLCFSHTHIMFFRKFKSCL